MAESGRLLVLDGPDGCGKSTQAARLAAWLASRGRTVHHLRDPGGTAIGEGIRALLLDRERGEVDPMAEMLLFMASRAQLVAERIRPALAAGEDVVCERWLTATVCYQGYALGLDVGEIWRLGELSTGRLEPDLTLVLDVDPEVGLARAGEHPDRLESRSREYHAAVRAGYLSIVAEGRLNSRLVAPGTIEQVEARVREAVARVL